MPMTEAQGAPIPELCSAPWWWSSGCLQPMEGIEGILETGDLSRFRKKTWPPRNMDGLAKLTTLTNPQVQTPKASADREPLRSRWANGVTAFLQICWSSHPILLHRFEGQSSIQLEDVGLCSWMYLCILSYFIIFYHILSYLIIFYHILWYFIIFYHILSYFINVHHFWCRLGRGQLATPLASLGPGDDGRGQAMESPGGY